MDELAQLTEQADAMARQLIKRADQLVVERGQTREAALTYLLRLVVQGRSGAVPPEFQPPAAETQNKPDSSAK